MTRSMRFVGLVAVLSCMVGAAHAEVVSSSGDVERVPPPRSVAVGATESDTHIRLFKEREDVQLASDLAVDATEPGTYLGTSRPGGVIPAGTRVSSYFLHADQDGTTGSADLTATVVFGRRVLGLVYGARLVPTTSVLGAPNTTYPANAEAYENHDGTHDSVTLGADRQTVTVRVRVFNVADQLRVVTLPDYDFTGFFPPVDNLGVVNEVRAGGAVPVKFSLGADQGLDIFAAGSPTSREVECDDGAETNNVEETVSAGGSSLQYDPTTEQYTYVWKTDRAWAGQCRQLVVTLDDGTTHRADFHFS